MAPKDLQVRGLLDAFRKVVASGADRRRRRNIVVHDLRPCDAKALMVMVHIANKRVERKWVLRNGGRVKRLIKANNCLSIVAKAILPALLHGGTDPTLVQALTRFAIRLRTQAMATGGRFHARALLVSEHLLANAADASANPPSKSLPALQVSVEKLIHEITDLQAEEATIAQNDA